MFGEMNLCHSNSGGMPASRVELIESLLGLNSVHQVLQDIKMIQEPVLKPDPISQESVVGFLLIKVLGMVVL